VDSSTPAQRDRAIAVPSAQPFKGLFIAAHFVLPGMAIAMIVGRGWFHMRLDWEVVVVAAIALIPFLLPLIAVYVAKGGGFEARDFVPGSSQATTSLPVTSDGMDMIPAVTKYPRFSSLGNSVERDILRTLAHYQQQQLPTATSDDNPLRVWGFSMKIEDKDRALFENGLNMLSNSGLVYRDQKGMIFLTRAGLHYCHNPVNRAALVAAGPAWVFGDKSSE
jgi:hypothetical protein